MTELVTEGVVNTMPEATLDAVADHGRVHGDTVRHGWTEAREVFDGLAQVGISFADVVHVLEDEGVLEVRDGLDGSDRPARRQDAWHGARRRTTGRRFRPYRVRCDADRRITRRPRRPARRAGLPADEGIATAAYLAIVMGRPLFCEGDAGVGKTALAHALAGALGAPLIRLQCYEGLDAAQALYDWDFPRQLLHLRAAEAAGVTTRSGSRPSSTTGASWWRGRCCRRWRRRRACCSSTRWTVPTTSSRRSCSRCSATGRSPCRSSAPSGPRRRRSSS